METKIVKNAAPEIRRRTLLAAFGAIAAVAESPDAFATAIPPGVSKLSFHGLSLTAVDLSNELRADAISFVPNSPRLSMQPVAGSGFEVGMNMNRLSLIEHTGTHIDAPRHFDKTGASLGEIPIGDLVVPLAVVDVRSKVAKDPNTVLEVEDILAWERQHGPLPEGCCVAMYGGWDKNAKPGHDFPGIGPEVGEFLISKRHVKGVGVEAGSLDSGKNSPAYPLHQLWLRSGRWGLEFMTNLDQVPPAGALLIVGAAPIHDATGMPVRLVALF